MNGKAESDRSVLLPVNDSGSSVSCVRSLSKHGVHTVVVSEHPDRPVFASRYCDEVLTVPSPYDDLIAYKDALLSAAERPDVYTIIPHREMDSYVLGKYRAEFEEHVVPLWPSFENIRTVHDGLRMVEAAREAEIPIPETWSFEDVVDWDRELIVKPRYSILTSDYVNSLSPNDCEGKMEPIYVPPGTEPDLKTIQAAMHTSDCHAPDHIPIVQELIRDTRTEYGFRGLCTDGTSVLTCQKRQIRGTSYAGGASAFRKTMHDPRLEELGRTLLEHLGWNGLASVQFLRDPDSGEYRFTEINPRVWASIEMDVLAGADFPYAHWLVATDNADRIESDYELDTGNHLLIGELQYLWSVLRDEYPLIEPPRFRRALWAVVSSCYDQPHFDFVHLDDPGPFVRGVLNQLSIGGRPTGETAGE
ncbi:carboxylate--amine ligase [Halocatena pleomorpha]|uniref:Carboxylate--amine ligase n=1 Tax=Halocatena pleomorpha TaxID=1785090 RepID=A0A3P3RFU4_9EURY|nr:ATP-grasp domain-containing protein [Halocatena pleomorpha]RRJ31829.1 carboxylate--amine ligase [Halocatena pleomorpha]